MASAGAVIVAHDNVRARMSQEQFNAVFNSKTAASPEAALPVITFSWDGMDQGGWKLIGGSGKWSKARGSGTWKDTGPMGAGFTRNTWTGSIRMK